MSDRLSASELIASLVDDGSWTSWDTAVVRSEISEEYAAELAAAAEKSGVDESVLTGRATIEGRPVALIAGEFGFLAGSIGRAAADRLVAAVEHATAEGLPLVGLTCSGGTRMQEGTPAFVQMVRIGAAITAHRAAGLAYVAYLRHPTTGGVMASWGALGQIVFAEPGALVGFLGPRVYSAMHGQDFPSGIQLAEHLADIGVIDGAVEPSDLRELLGTTLRALTVDALPTGTAAPDLTSRRARVDPSADQTRPFGGVDAWEAVTRTRREDRPGVCELLAAASDVVLLNGTQAGETDATIALALARFGGQPCVVVGQDRAAEAAGEKLGPAGLRVARRGFALAAELRIPVVTVIDTRGAELSVDAEEGAVAGEIARCLSELVACGAPTLSVLLGEGNGGGALAFLPADRILAAQHAWLSPLPPEGASAIVHRTTERAADLARSQQVLALQLHERGVVDVIVPELPDAADEPDTFSVRLADVIAGELAALRIAGPGTPAQRAARYDF
ncbi:carboxyl transferase domain-containing protein [Nocardioides cavernaquae]|uniref:Acetyl-CoA carboxyl transferase n=1 Tax=Nocardioides cavernaquae TaxID=2321396 RepID=A0A3A5H5M2_9ACTN|nr:carboxyl transferase domain-containing protein [Nocardioides cavernaquae]RJS45979.1 acetyl-CoA carboxyl transferase [Nocardioides cavernaquae]